MACDVHAHFEIKVDNEWIHYSRPQFLRNYTLFEKMAGVRGNIENAISKPKGLPDFISKTVKLDYEYHYPNIHNTSWLNKKEIKELYEYHEIITDIPHEFYNQWGYLYGNGWENFDEFREDYPDYLQDFRLIFWFDN